MYKALFLDLDGTLLDDNKNISEENKNAIQYATNKGAYVIITSGRAITATQIFLEKMQGCRYIIFSNGAGIYDVENNEFISLITIEKELCLEMYRYAIKKDICMRFDTNYGRFITNMKYAINTDIKMEEDIEEFLDKNLIIQVSFIHDSKEKIYELIKNINDNLGKDLKVEDVFITGPNGDFFATCAINPAASKGNAVCGMCKFLKIDLQDAIAMGDGLNDISMLSVVGLGVAMGNATSETKEAAKEITCTNNENGVAKIIMSNF